MRRGIEQGRAVPIIKNGSKLEEPVHVGSCRETNA